MSVISLKEPCIALFPKIWEISNTSCVHHDNSPSHTAFNVMENLTKRWLATLSQQPYSSDLVSHVFFFFPRIKTELKGQHFGALETVKQATARCLKEVSVDVFTGAFNAYEKRWRWCSHAKGSFFEEI